MRLNVNFKKTKTYFINCNIERNLTSQVILPSKLKTHISHSKSSFQHSLTTARQTLNNLQTERDSLQTQLAELCLHDYNLSDIEMQKANQQFEDSVAD